MCMYTHTHTLDTKQSLSQSFEFHADSDSTTYQLTGQCFSNVSKGLTHLEAWGHTRLLDTDLPVADSAGPGRGLRACIPTKFPGDADAAALRDHTENHRTSNSYVGLSCSPERELTA